MKFRKLLSPVSRGQGFTERMLSVAGGIIAGTLAILVTTDVTLRYVFNSPIAGLYELSEFMLIGTIYLGIAYVQTQKGHVRIEIFTAKLPPKAQQALNIFAYLIGIVAFGLITWRTGYMAWVAWDMNDYSMGLVQWPIWPARSLVPLGAGLLCLRLIRDMWQEFAPQ